MPLKISIPDSSNATSDISLGGINYTFGFYYNSRDQRYRIDIYEGTTPVIIGLKVVENTILTYKYDLPDFDHGELVVFQFKDTSAPVGRDNFGIDKAYELIYFTNEELLALGTN